MKILSIIISYNFSRWIRPCLDSLMQSETPTDILVVDNASSDNSVAIIRSEYPQVRIIENKDNSGFGHANNIGFQIALQEGYDFVLLLNQDAWIDKDLLGELTRLSDEFNDFGILSSVHLTGDRKDIDKGSPGEYILKDQSKTDLIEVPFINAAIWLIPIQALKKAGGFSPLFRHYGEDVDFVNRMHYHGFKIGYCPYVCGCHDRAKRITTKSMVRRATAVYCLTLWADINQSLLSATTQCFKCCFHHLGKSIMKREWEGASYFLKILMKFLTHFRTIYKERGNARKNGIDFIKNIRRAYDLIPF